MAGRTRQAESLLGYIVEIAGESSKCRPGRAQLTLLEVSSPQVKVFVEPLPVLIDGLLLIGEL